MCIAGKGIGLKLSNKTFIVIHRKGGREDLEIIVEKRLKSLPQCLAVPLLYLTFDATSANGNGQEIS